MSVVNKLADIIPIMQSMGSKEVAKAIIEEQHKGNNGETKPQSKHGRKPKSETNEDIEIVK